MLRFLRALLICALALAMPGALLSSCTPQQVAALAAVASGAYEAQVRAEAAARGLPANDPALLKAIDAAREADAKAAAESKARDEAQARRLTKIASALAELRARPVCAPCGGGVDAGVEGGER